MKQLRTHSAFTLIELLVVISIIGILATAGFAAYTAAIKSGRLAGSLQNAKQIATSMKIYSNDNSGSYPTFVDPETQSQALTNANEAMQALMPKYLTDKKYFINANSAYCKGVAQDSSGNNQYNVMAGQNDWCYVTNISDISDARWPLFCTALMTGAKTYTKDTSQKGGVWGGTNSIVGHADGSVTQEKTRGGDTTPYVGRPDKPNSNMFEPGEGWITSSTILYPL